MQDLNPQQKKLLRLAKLVDKKEIGVLEEIDNLDSKLKDVETKVEQAISIAEETQKMEGKEGIEGKQGEKGIDGKDGLDGKDGKNGVDGKNGTDGVDGKDGANGKDGLNGKDGKDGSPDTGEQIIEKINTDKTTLIKREKVEGLKQLEDRIIAVGERVVKGSGVGISQPQTTGVGSQDLQSVTDEGATTDKVIEVAGLDVGTSTHTAVAGEAYFEDTEIISNSKITGEMAKVQTSQPSTQVGDLWWDTDDAGNGNIGAITTVTDTYQVLITDETIICNKSTAFTVTLPTAVVGQIFNISNINTGIVTLEGASSDTINGELNQEIEEWETIQVQCYIANKWVIL